MSLPRVIEKSGDLNTTLVSSDGSVILRANADILDTVAIEQAKAEITLIRGQGDRVHLNQALSGLKETYSVDSYSTESSSSKTGALISVNPLNYGSR